MLHLEHVTCVWVFLIISVDMALVMYIVGVSFWKKKSSLPSDEDFQLFDQLVNFW